jgi:hypothetical protein
MGRFASVFAVMTVGFSVACTVTTTEGPAPSSDPSPDPSGTGTGKAPPPAPGNPSDVSAKNPPAASTVPGAVELNNACPGFVGCSANPIGTYDYKGGCIGDVFAEARQQCPAMQTVGVKADVVGSITFDGAALARDVNAHVSGKLVFPSDCTLGQCGAVENALKGAFDSAKCVPQAGGCQCDVSKTSTTKDLAAYTISGTTLTTDDGETYDICETGSSLSYHGNSAGSESGSWSLAKR